MAFINVENIVKEYYVSPGASKDGQSQIKGLKALFRKDTKRVVDDISFHIEKGEIVGYIGPNGAGKSTTVKMLTGILVPTSGKIEVDGMLPHYPFLGLFGKSDAMFSGYIAFLSPLVAVIMILISAASWKIGLRNYKSAGN